jgi:ketol-acid reductoisomerase
MTTIALLGAGGKMGLRITDNLKDSAYDVRYVEVAEAGRAALAERGVEVSSDGALGEADVAIFALPDTLLGELTRRFVPRLPAGALVLLLDPAAPYAGDVHLRGDLAYAVAHPAHPGIFNWEPTEAAFRDFYGGVSARQPVLLALMQGDANARRTAEEVARAIYAPIAALHEVTLEQMAILEPALVETLAQTCIEAVRRGYDRVVELGVPADAARDFVLGHLRIQIAVLFGEVDGTFSDAAYRISRRAWPRLFRDDWDRIFAPDDLRDQVETILRQPDRATAGAGRGSD